MKSILQINTVINSGSTGRIAEQIGQIAMNNGWESYIAYGRNTRQSKSNIIKIGTKLDIYYHWIITRLFDKHGLGSANATLKLIEKIKIINPNIIHLHNLHGYYLNLEILFNYFSNINTPVVWTLHDCWPLTGHCTHFDYIGCNKWQDICNNCPQISEYPKSFWIDRSKENYLLKKELFTSVKNIQLIAVSSWLENYIKKSFLSKYAIHVIRNGIDLKLFSPASCEKKKLIMESLKLTNKFIILGIASVWSKRKGLDDFIKLNEHLSSEFQIIIVGLNQKQLKEIPLNIIGIERTENIVELAGLYSIADVFFNPTYEDNYPSTILESISCGTPVVTYDTGGCKEAVDEKTGIIIKKGDIKSALDAFYKIRKIGKDAFSSNCVNRAKLNFDNNIAFLSYVKLYNSLLENL